MYSVLSCFLEYISQSCPLVSNRSSSAEHYQLHCIKVYSHDRIQMCNSMNYERFFKMPFFNMHTLYFFLHLWLRIFSFSNMCVGISCVHFILEITMLSTWIRLSKHAVVVCPVFHHRIESLACDLLNPICLLHPEHCLI
jgi:hypothetical protein